ncbi:MAG: HAMP domain-containing protein [Anaerolineae bacterium]|nr:HAMP domain-containing protein [Anaerolineae bacterium]
MKDVARLHLANWVERLWAVLGSVSIRTKILGIVLGLVSLFGLTITVQVRTALTQALEQQLQEQAISVGRDLAARATDLLLINNLYALHELLHDTLANNPNVRYAFILNPDDAVVVHTFGEGFPVGLQAANRVAASDHHNIRLLATDEGPIWDVAVPIFDGRAGVARVGLSEARLHHTVNTITSQLLIIVVLIWVIGVSAAAFLTWALTRPILQLMRAAQAVGRGEFNLHLPRWANDELGELADAFNAMTAALARAAQERAERETLRNQYVSGVIAAQEEERKRIARELHDSTSQALSSLILGLRALSMMPDDVPRRAEELRQIAARTLDEVHSLSLQLRPSVLDDLGLAAALERHVNDWRRRANLHIDLALSGFEQRLPPQVETALYRIVQEALTNIIRHAHAQTASIYLERRDHSVRAIIEDDGVGFDPRTVTHKEGHLGLYGIRERVELLGGKLVIESAPQQGCSLLVEIPLDWEGSALTCPSPKFYSPMTTPSFASACASCLVRSLT